MTLTVREVVICCIEGVWLRKAQSKKINGQDERKRNGGWGFGKDNNCSAGPQLSPHAFFNFPSLDRQPKPNLQRGWGHGSQFLPALITQLLQPEQALIFSFLVFQIHSHCSLWLLGNTLVAAACLIHSALFNSRSLHRFLVSSRFSVSSPVFCLLVFLIGNQEIVGFRVNDYVVVDCVSCVNDHVGYWISVLLFWSFHINLISLHFSLLLYEQSMGWFSCIFAWIGGEDWLCVIQIAKDEKRVLLVAMENENRKNGRWYCCMWDWDHC